jgi:hypothetical protein
MASFTSRPARLGGAGFALLVVVACGVGWMVWRNEQQREATAALYEYRKLESELFEGKIEAEHARLRYEGYVTIAGERPTADDVREIESAKQAMLAASRKRTGPAAKQKEARADELNARWRAEWVRLGLLKN